MGLRLVAVAALLFVGCGMAIGSSSDAGAELEIDGGVEGEVDGGSAMSTVPVCEGIESAARAPAQSCAAPSIMIGVGTTLTPRARGIETYGVASVIATSDAFHSTGEDVRNAPWVDGDDVSVGFRAPRGGKWRLTARGSGAHRLVATRSCSAPSSSDWERTFSRSSDSWIMTGAELTTEVSLEVFAERDERFDVVVDGCPRGSRCSFSVRAERLSGLECASGNPCAATDQCFIDRCDAERYACVSKKRLRQISPDAAHAWRDGATIFVVGAAANWPKNLPPLHRFIRFELLDASGAVAPHALGYPSTTITNGRFSASRVHDYARSEVRSVRMSFSDNEYAPVTEPSSVVAIGAPPSPRPLGASCVPGDALGPCEKGECASSLNACSFPTPRIIEARGVSQVFDGNGLAWNGPMVFMDLVVEGLTPTGWSASVRDVAGAELVSGEVHCDFSEPFSTRGTRLACLIMVPAEMLGRVATVRLAGTWNGVSLTHDVPTQPVPTAGFGEACGTRGRSVYLLGEIGRCDEGLICDQGVCALPRQFLCSGAALSTWAPSVLPSSITGATASKTYSRSCGGTSQVITEFVFVAPETASFTFTITGSATAQVSCTASGCGAQPLTGAPVTLERGARVRVGVVTTDATPTFSIRAERSR